MFVEILKESLNLLKKNMNLVQLILIFFIVTTIFMPVMATFKLNIKMLPVAIIFFALICAFCAGLFFAFKKSLEYRTNPPKPKNEFDLSPLYFAEFFQGTGSYFVKFLYAGLLTITLFGIFMLGYKYCIHHYFQIPQSILSADIKHLLSDDKALMSFVSSLSENDKGKIGMMSLFTLFIASLFGLITLLYPVALVNEDKNFLKCFWISIKSLLKNPVIAIVIFLFFNITITCAGILSSFNNLIIAVFAMLLQCYLNTWYILSLFVYYEKVK